MKKITKVLSLIMVVAMLLSMSAIIASAAEPTSGTITIENAAKGETYKVYLLFTASVTGEDNGSIVYEGTIPDSLKAYFEEKNGYIIAKDSALSADAISAMKAWAEGQTPAAEPIVGDGSAVVFSNLAFGYYVVTSTQGESAISVTSTNPNATIKDKNTDEPYITKDVDDHDVYIGQTVTYTAISVTTNYLGEGSNNQRVTRYEISDTLPSFLEQVKVISIKIDADGNKDTTDDQSTLPLQQFVNNKISIDWVDAAGNSLYNNGALIILTYTAVVTDQAEVDGTTGNVNVVTLQPYVGEDTPWEKTWEDEEKIFTYAASLQKVDENKNPLAGAKFKANGLIVDGSKGNYTVVSYDASSQVLGTEMETDDLGNLVIKGLNSDAILKITETEAPAGYNKLAGTIDLKPAVISEVVTATTGKVWYNPDGSVSQTETTISKDVVTYNDNLKNHAHAIKVVNEKGAVLPETGGMGTTMFLIFGSMTALAAAVVLVARKKTAGYR